MIELPNVTIWAAWWSGQREGLERTVRVLDYSRSILKPARFVLFAWLPSPYQLNIQPWYQHIAIPELNWSSWSLFVNHSLAKYIHTSFALCVHEDGFPIAPELWSPEFLEYDYIGAPWNPKECTGWITPGSDLIVGNGGFFIWSKRFMDLVASRPIETLEYSIAADVWVCRVKRALFEREGMRFAPPDVAARFSTEQTHKNTPSFGFHGRRDSPQKYRQGWQLIEEWEKAEK